MAAELLALVNSGTIRVVDILILTKDEDGAVEAVELADVRELGELQALEAQLAELLAEEDVEHLAAAMEPNSTAGVLIWENLWAAPFASAARRSGDQLIATGRIPFRRSRLHRGRCRTDERRRLRDARGQRVWEKWESSARRWRGPPWYPGPSHRARSPSRKPQSWPRP